MRRFTLILALVAIAFLGWKGFEAYLTQQATTEAVNPVLRPWLNIVTFTRMAGTVKPTTCF